MIWRDGAPQPPRDVCGLLAPIDVGPRLAIWSLGTADGVVALALPETWEPPTRARRVRPAGMARVSWPCEARPAIGESGLRAWEKELAHRIFVALQIEGRVVDRAEAAERLWIRIDDDVRRSWNVWVAELPGLFELREAARGTLANGQRWLWLAAATSGPPGAALRSAFGDLGDAVILGVPGADRSWQAALLAFCSEVWGGGGWRTAVVEAPRRWFVEGQGRVRSPRPWTPDAADGRGAGLWVGPWLTVRGRPVPPTGHIAGWLCSRGLPVRGAVPLRVRGFDAVECEPDAGWGPLVSVGEPDEGGAEVRGRRTTAVESGWWQDLEVARIARELARRVVAGLGALREPPSAEQGRAWSISVAMEAARLLWTDGLLVGRAFSEAVVVKSARWDWPDDEVLGERYLLDIEARIRGTELPVRMRVVAGRRGRARVDFS